MVSSDLVYLLPVVCALLGWLVAKLCIAIYITVFLKRKAQIGTSIGEFAEKQISLDAIEQKLTQAETIEKILPFADVHIEDFLRVKLPAAMPMLAMFISDKLVNDMKAIFMNELKQLFPALIQQYIGNVKKDLRISQLISSRFNSVADQTLQSFLWKQLRIVEISSFLTGFLCGCLYIFLTRIA